MNTPFKNKRPFSEKAAIRAEFSGLRMAWEISGSVDVLIELRKFSEKGPYHERLLDEWLRKRRNRRSRAKNTKRLGSSLEDFFQVLNTKPMQGGAPSLGKKR